MSKRQYITFIRSLIKRMSRRTSRATGLASVPSWFDSSWYLQMYPDVAAAKMDPWWHYSHYGRDEGRLPAPNRALAMGHALWRGAQDVMLPRLQGLLVVPDATFSEKCLARWELARWYACQNDWGKVVDILPPTLVPSFFQAESICPRLLLVEALCRLQTDHSCKNDQYLALSEQVLLQLHNQFSNSADTVLAESNLLLANCQQEKDIKRLELLNQLWAVHNLAAVRFHDASQPLSIDNLAATTTSFDSSINVVETGTPLVSVIVPIYNAADTLPTMLRGLFAQTWPRIELLLVDDCSTDDSLAVINSLQAKCPSHIQLWVLEQTSNQGAYAARNRALAIAKGDFITTHDSDDWSHPQKIEQQVIALLKSSAPACLSYWARVTDDLLFHHWRLDDHGWVYPNMSSLMFKSSVVKHLGFWDQVRVNGDTEYRERIEAVFGAGSVISVLPSVPLSFGRADAGSLSQHSETHLVTQFAGVRNDYMQAARAWHSSVSDSHRLYLSDKPKTRPFVAPTSMLSEQQLPVIEPRPKDQTRVSSLFDAGWYFQRYIHLQQSMLEPFEHFWVNAIQGGDPGPNFSSSGYLRMCPDALNAENPLWHFLENSQSEDQMHKVLPIWTGKKFREECSTLMICGHQNGSQLFGAERSLLDMLAALDQLGFNLVVTLPEAMNFEYEQTILSHCSALAVIPYGWWQKGRRPVEATISHFSRLIEQFNVVAVHANTLVLDEPLRAARLNNIPSVIHVRELPAADLALCETLGAEFKEIITHAAELADLLIANSHHTKNEFYQTLADTVFGDLPIEVVPNTVSMDSLLTIPEVQRRANNQVLRVGMLSSNIPKKGLADFEALSLLLQGQAGIELILVGPQTEPLNVILDKQSLGKLPKNIIYWGYANEPEDALKDIDVVINLSHFQESFGRTVLEAMTSARPVVAYDFGALPELIEHDVTGYLVPLGDVEMVASYLQALYDTPTLFNRLGVSARKRAVKNFGIDTVVAAMGKAYQKIKLIPADVSFRGK